MKNKNSIFFQTKNNSYIYILFISLDNLKPIMNLFFSPSKRNKNTSKFIDIYKNKKFKSVDLNSLVKAKSISKNKIIIKKKPTFFNNQNFMKIKQSQVIKKKLNIKTKVHNKFKFKEEHYICRNILKKLLKITFKKLKIAQNFTKQWVLLINLFKYFVSIKNFNSKIELCQSNLKKDLTLVYIIIYKHKNNMNRIGSNLDNRIINYTLNSLKINKINHNYKNNTIVKGIIKNFIKEFYKITSLLVYIKHINFIYIKSLKRMLNFQRYTNIFKEKNIKYWNKIYKIESDKFFGNKNIYKTQYNMVIYDSIIKSLNIDMDLIEMCSFKFFKINKEWTNYEIFNKRYLRLSELNIEGMDIKKIILDFFYLKFPLNI